VPVTSFPITVALVEDDQGTHQRLANAIAANSGLILVFQASTAKAAIDWVKTHQPNVLLVDLGLPDGSGVDVIQAAQRHSPHTDVMVITMFGDEANMIRAFEAGARGYLLKDGTEEDLASHIKNLHAGGSPMSPIIARRLLSRFAPKEPTRSAIDALSPKESEVLLLLSRGYTYAELAKMLSVKITTVHTHVRNIYSKLSVHSKTEAVYEARQLGLLDP
jgi:DNA-binding NarL/FixJ family response regulator